MGQNKEKSLTQKVREIRAKYKTAKTDESFVFFKVLESEGLNLDNFQRYRLKEVHKKHRLDSIFREIRRAKREERKNSLQTIPPFFVQEPVKKPVNLFGRLFRKR